jgi:hypothetical protein
MLAEEYPVTVACEVLGVVRSSYYYQPVASPDDVKLKGAIKKTAAEASTIFHAIRTWFWTWRSCDRSKFGCVTSPTSTCVMALSTWQ